MAATQPPDSMGLIDTHGRQISYLRLSVVEQCQFRCFYCMPKGGLAHGARSDALTVDEMARLVAAFARLGVRYVRLTGGEPLLRRDLEALAAVLAALPGVDDLSLSTNGGLLAGRAAALCSAGVSRINLSLDSLDPQIFAWITRGARLERVLAGIDAARAAGFAPIKLNMVVLRGVNDHEIPAMIGFARERGLDLRFIETMPIGREGIASMRLHLPAEEILARVRNHLGGGLVPVAGTRGAGPARHYRVADGDFTVGVISAVSRHFCSGCNRVRLSARGDLLLCLGQADRVALGELLRAGVDDAGLEAAIVAAIARKPFGHDFGRDRPARVEMSRIGG